MGAGFALREEYVAGKTKDWVTFKFPNIRHAMDLETILVETPRELGTLGSVGIGEMAMVSTAPAIVNAIRDACGRWSTSCPPRRSGSGRPSPRWTRRPTGRRRAARRM